MGCLTRDTGQREPLYWQERERERESKATFLQPFPFASMTSHICFATLLPFLFVVVLTKNYTILFVVPTNGSVNSALLAVFSQHSHGVYVCRPEYNGKGLLPRKLNKKERRI